MAIPKLLTTRQASAATGFSVQKIIRLIDCGRLPAINTSVAGKRPRWSIRESDLEAFFQPSNAVDRFETTGRRRQRLDAHVPKVV